MLLRRRSTTVSGRTCKWMTRLPLRSFSRFSRSTKAPPPGADHLVLRGHDVADRFAFDGAKALFAILAKDFGDGAPSHLFDASVAVHERQPQASGDVAPERRLAAAAEADQDQVVHPSMAVSCSTFSVTAKIGQRFLEAVAAELEAHGVRQHQRHHGLADDARRWDDAHITAFDVGNAALRGWRSRWTAADG